MTDARHTQQDLDKVNEQLEELSLANNKLVYSAHNIQSQLNKLGPECPEHKGLTEQLTRLMDESKQEGYKEKIKLLQETRDNLEKEIYGHTLSKSRPPVKKT